MILSHKYKFIFLKTNKTAGTSIEIALSKHCEAEDIITPITPEDEAIRRELGYRGPQHYEAPLREYSFRELLRRQWKGKKKKRFFNHMSAAEVKQFVPEDVWREYFKFCVVRNPWDRVISLYYHLYGSEPRPPIAELIESETIEKLISRSYGLYTIDGELAVDHLCRFENLKDELETICKRVGIPEPLELPRAKAGFRKDKRSYQETLSRAEIERIAERFRAEVELMGYEV